MVVDYSNLASSAKGDYSNYAKLVSNAWKGKGDPSTSDLTNMLSSWSNNNGSDKSTKQNIQELKNNSSLWENTTKLLVRGFQTQELQSTFPSMAKELLNMSDIEDVLTEKQGNRYTAGDFFRNIGIKALSQMETQLQQQSMLLTEINTKTGLTGKLSEDYREELTSAYPRLLQLGIGMSELSESAVQLVAQTGKFALINKDTWEDAAETAKAYVGTLSEIVSQFALYEKIGFGALDATKAIEIAGKKSLELGLNSQKITKDLSISLGRLNEYGFKNGVQGLAAMVRTATEFRLNMDEVFKVADKVWTPEGALELSANLQVLGGAMGDFNDPIKLMWMATNNVEGLQDVILETAGSLATYNDEQGRFEITGINLRKAKEMADKMGISMGELTKSAVAYQERMSAKGTLDMFSIDDEDKEFLTNISQMQGGKMTIQLQSQELKDKFQASSVAIEDLSESQIEILKAYREDFKRMTSDDIVRKQATNVENILRDVNFMAAMIRVKGGAVAAEAGKFTGLDFASLAATTHELSKTSGESITKISAQAIQFMEDHNIDYDKVKITASDKKTESFKALEEQAKKVIKQEPTRVPTADKKVEATLNINVDSNGDAIANELRRRGDIGEQIVGYYTNNLTSGSGMG